MAAFDKARAIARMNTLVSLIRVGAYQEREPDGSYAPDGIERGVDELEFEAARHGLLFVWHREKQTHTLEPMEASDRASFLIAHLPSGIERDLRMNYQAHGDVLPSMARRHWREIPGTRRGSVSPWTCDGYASSRQYAGVIAEQLHTAFGHTYEILESATIWK